jgi:hypothetical protein
MKHFPAHLCLVLGIAALVTVAGCSLNTAGSASKPQTAVIAHDFATPEGAILCLEDAYRAQDIEKAVACKDFQTEARLMLAKLQKIPLADADPELIQKTAEVLELGFRKQVRTEGFPNMNGVLSTFPAQEPVHENIVVVTEECRYPDGNTSKQRILVGKTKDGWRVLNPEY